ncbi:MAG: phage portal protein [Gemmatimonadales bacterium]|nr:phage portal protein [Gemmatimonadales bacterium]
MGVWARIRNVFKPTPAPPRRARPSMARYAAAAVTRLTSSWMGGLRSANQEVDGVLTVLRGRSRQLCRDNPHAKGFLTLLKVNVSGPDGIGLQAQYLNTRNELHTTYNRAVELAWAKWGRAATATADGRLSWPEFLQQCDALEAQDGEILIQRIRDPAHPYRYTVRLLDPDQLDESLSQRGSDGTGPEIRMGVELGRYGRPVAYWIRPRHPNEPGGRTDANKPERIPASDVLHCFIQERPGQVRGVPWLTPVALRIRLLDKWEEAALTAATIGAAKMGFFVDKREDPGEGYDTPTDADSGADEGGFRMDAEPGTFGQLPPGMEFQSFDPDYPNIAFEQFERAMLRSIATGLGVSYTSLANDLTAVNYSSIRAGLLTERDVYRMLQHRRIEHVCRPVFRDWLEEATLADQIGGAIYRFDDVAEAMVWKPRGWAWVDPKSDVQAVKEMIALGLDSRTAAAARLGGDFQDNLEMLKREMDLADTAGVPIMGLTSQGDQVGETTNDSSTGTSGAGSDASDDAARAARLRVVRGA